MCEATRWRGFQVPWLSGLLVAALSAGALADAPATQPAAAGGLATRPNIVFILADDLGWTDLACTGSCYYETPHIDRMAREGMRFTSFYVSQNCAPTRACLMTGQYAPRTGVYTVRTLERGSESDRRMIPPANRTDLPLDRMTVADVLRRAGYATAIFGKWHLGEKGDHHPGRRGFDEAIVSMGRHYNFRTNPPVEVPPGTYLADFLTDRALRFIEKNRDRPFFLYLPHFAVHTPHEAKPGLVARFKDKPPAGGHGSPVYAAMIAALDESVGRVLARLDELKLAERTLVIFASDNGGVGGYRAAGIDADGVTDNAPLRAGKGTLYEGGIRVPFIARWPGTVRAGAICDEPAIHVDLMPTLLALAAAPAPDQPLDGLSLAPLLKNPLASFKRDSLYWHFPGYLEAKKGSGWRTTPVGVIRTGHLKLMEFFETGRCELYDLRADIGEKHDLAAERPRQVRALRENLAAWRQSLHAAMPQPKP